MPTFILTEPERRVLQVLADNDDAWLTFYYHEMIEAAGDIDRSEAICKGLRKRKLIDAEGRGMHSNFAINDRGREALAQR